MAVEDELAALARSKTLLANIGAALDALLISGVQEYSLSTGQTVQRVTRIDAVRLQEAYDSTLNRIAVLEQRLGIRSGTHYAELET